MSQNMSLNSCP